MSFNIESIIFYLILLDAIGANIFAWFFVKKYKKKLKGFWKHLPVTRGWAAIYLALVLWTGSALYRMGILSCTG